MACELSPLEIQHHIVVNPLVLKHYRTYPKPFSIPSEEVYSLNPEEVGNGAAIFAESAAHPPYIMYGRDEAVA